MAIQSERTAGDNSSNGASDVNEIRRLLDAIQRTLQTELSVKNFQTEVLTQLLRQQEIIVCWIESISRQTCSSLNEANYQTALQRSIRDALTALLEIGKAAHPAAALEFERMRELNRRIEECCPPEEPPPICQPQPCVPSSLSSHGSASCSTVRASTRQVEGAKFPRSRSTSKERAATRIRSEGARRTVQRLFRANDSGQPTGAVVFRRR